MSTIYNGIQVHRVLHLSGSRYSNVAKEIINSEFAAMFKNSVTKN